MVVIYQYYHRYFNHKHRDATCMFAQARPPNALHSSSYNHDSYGLSEVGMPVVWTFLRSSTVPKYAVPKYPDWASSKLLRNEPHRTTEASQLLVVHAESAAPSWAGPRQGVEQGEGRVVVIESGRTYNIYYPGGGGGGGSREFGRTPPLLFFPLHARGRACYSQFNACTSCCCCPERQSARRSVCAIFLRRKS